MFRWAPGSTTTRRRARASPSRLNTSSKELQPSQRTRQVKTYFLRILAVFAAALFAAAASAQQDFSKVEIQTEKLADTVYMMTGAGGNLGVSVGEDAVFVNDDQVRAFHVPRAHTDGDVMIHFAKGDVIHMGDAFFNKLYPFIDTSSGGTVEGVLAAA